MSLPFGMGVFGLVVSLIFIARAVLELRKNTPGHSRNAAMIHLAMGSMFLPFSLIIMFIYS